MGAAAGSVAMADELLAGVGGETAVLGVAELREAIKTTLDKLGPRERVLIIPPVGAADSSTPSRANAAAAVAERGAAPVRAQDFTRAHSQAGIVTKLVYEYYGDRVKDILPALGSHVRPTPATLRRTPPTTGAAAPRVAPR